MFTHITDTTDPHPHMTVSEAMACEDDLAFEAAAATWKTVLGHDTKHLSAAAPHFAAHGVNLLPATRPAHA